MWIVCELCKEVHMWFVWSVVKDGWVGGGMKGLFRGTHGVGIV